MKNSFANENRAKLILSQWKDVRRGRNLAMGSSSPCVGAGAGTTYKLNDRWSLYADMAYQVITSEFTGGAGHTGMSVAAGSNGFMDINIGAQLRLGK